MANGDFLVGGDAKGSMYLSMNILKQKSFFIAPKDFPDAFIWQLKTESGIEKGNFRSWSGSIAGRDIEELYQKGILSLDSSKYYLAESKYPGLYINTFGIGSALTALPVYAFLDLVIEDLADSRYWLWYGGKLAAALTVAGSVVFIFLCMTSLTTTGNAFFLSICYGIGTNVWSVSSQALWQHGPNVFFITLGTLFLCRVKQTKLTAMGSAFAYGAAVFCRPTSTVIVLCVGFYYLATNRKFIIHYCLAGLPLALLYIFYNHFTTGTFFYSGQLSESTAIALHKTGSPDLWQTPLLHGLTGLMLSPSRGLLIYSPFLAFGCIGIFLIWSDRRFSPLRPLAASVLILNIVAAKWFDWWGGWCFGYRPIVDTVPLLILCILPLADRINARKIFKACFVVLVTWSIVVQIIGSLSYNVTGWNSKNKMDIDLREYRHRLWSASDSQLTYYMRNFASERKQKKRHMLRELGD